MYPKFSIITVSYNSAHYITSAIESVLSQDYPNIEYIIIDGDSTDNTVDIIQSHANKSPEVIKWISEPDKGMYDALNKGIRMATGDIIGALNSDDFYSRTNALSTIADLFHDNPDLQSCFADVRYVKPDNLNKTVRYYSSKRFHPGRFKYGYMPAHPTFFVRKECFTKYGLYKTDYKIAGDYELLLRFLYIYKISYKYLSLDIIKMRKGGISTKNLNSNYVLNKEIIRGCKENGMYTNMATLSLKYFVKFFEFIRPRN